MSTKLKPLIKTDAFDIYALDTSTELELPYNESGISAGFPSAAADFMEDSIDLINHLIKNKASTYIARAKGVSLIDIGIGDGDLLILDHSIEPKNSCVAVCTIDGEYTIKVLMLKGKELYLMPKNEDYKPIKITEFNNFKIWSILTFSIKAHKH